MDRLFSASVQLIYEDEHGKQFIASHIADRGEFWWNPKRPHEPSLWESKIYLGEGFFNEIIRHPVPLDMNTLKAMKALSVGPRSLPVVGVPHLPRSSCTPLRLSWQQVYGQFGTDPAKADDKRTVDNFRTDCLRELKKIKLAWTELNYATAKGVLILLPSTPAIAPAEQLRLAE